MAAVGAAAAVVDEAEAAVVDNMDSTMFASDTIDRTASRMTIAWIGTLCRRGALALLLAIPLVAIAAPQQTFATPEAAVDALVAALKANDDAALIAIFGDDHKSLVVSPDRAATTETRAKILAAIQAFRVLDDPSKDRRILIIGDQAWPLPIPIVRTGDRWRYATEEGEDEIINRRIGGNELNAIVVLRAYLAAQRQYARRDRDGDDVLQYAQKLGSKPGKQDGLYWPADAAKGEELSPFGPLMADASPYLEGHAEGDPYRGYYFKILTRQGKSAPGGAYSYIINGRMIAGFAMVAYPARWGESGVMSFIVSNNGKIYQKDLGNDSMAIGAKITTFDPGPGWKEVAP